MPWHRHTPAHASHTFSRYSDTPPDGANGGKVVATLVLHAEITSRSSSSFFDSMSLPSGNGTSSGDHSDFVHRCTEFVTLGLGMLGVSGGLPSSIHIVWREGARTKHFGQSLRRCESSFNLDRD